MLDHVLGRPSTKSRRLQVLAVLSFWTAYLVKGNKHGPPIFQVLSRVLSRRLTAWQIVVVTMAYLYATRNFSTLVGLASPEPLANMYDTTYFRATWVLTALDAGFWTAMKIRNKWLRDFCSIIFTGFYLFQTEKADEKVRKVRANLTVEHLRVSWNKGVSPYIAFLQSLISPRFSRWPPRQIRIPRPATSDFKEPVNGWLYYDGPLSDLEHHNKMVLDFPGGGFVAMDPRCNDDRLLGWASKTGLPILSLDYKKAPEFPYPHSLNECYDVYTTIINTKGRCIGLPGIEMPRIILSGDSAGGNLATATTLMIIESGNSPVRRFQGQTDLPLPEALILFYPGLDMNIGNWMSDEQMSLIRDRRVRNTNRRIVRRKSMQYNNLVGTPHHSDDEDEGPDAQQQQQQPTLAITPPSERELAQSRVGADKARSPHPEYAHEGPSTWTKSQQQPSRQRPSAAARKNSNGNGNSVKGVTDTPSSSHHSEPLRTRLATSSMISYFNDRILSPEMMRAMIILYIGPHNRPDFSSDYLLSPVLAPDVLLARFPKTYFLTGERDPLVDDTVIFAGRLRRVKAAMHASGGRRFEYMDDDSLSPGFNEKDVAETVLIPGVSHGFMQYPTIYPPAYKWIDRSAGWIEEAFAAADRRERERRRALVSSNRGRNGPRATAAARPGGDGSPLTTKGEGRHHVRTESSGDEWDRPLEMSMTRPRGKAATEQQPEQEQPEEGSNAGEGDDQAASEAGANGSNADIKRRKSLKGNNGSIRGRREYKDKALNRLASSDDLLGRRMQGLAGGLTGLIEEE
ncbi:hormone-sensitive lipase [Gaeumannomyces tritici R3-111a-1]|uniref:Hormone-sensitive lipase n=1 Tax=Gaeumannomyces tritici (strain R3-111a-1) TaxID=644352 RepID=J3PCA3_GAET3|nr:hormone-sensitive lipase [Gaeumannomyces tritici R3-111a-1]EJT71873.1 hormone-sensitive lipase [Gaeumannomyces tritici R3-111a-1]